MLYYFVILCILSFTWADEDGRYVPDNSGHYIPDVSGQYIPDFSGNYRSDGLGGYRDDGTGRYSGQKDIYRDSKSGFGAGGGFGGAGGRFGAGAGSGSGNLVGANSFQSSQIRPVPKPAPIPVRPAVNPNSFGNQGSATNAIGIRSGSGKYNDEGKWKIIRQVGDVDLDGYHWEYLTENGINAEESGKLFNQGTDAEAIRAKGFFTYTGPDNVVYHIQYTADENGFVAQGDHLPTPPPLPEALLKAIELQRQAAKH